MEGLVLFDSKEPPCVQSVSDDDSGQHATTRSYLDWVRRVKETLFSPQHNLFDLKLFASQLVTSSCRGYGYTC